MRLIIGLTKKIGLPSFGSIGATCQLESSEFSGELAGDDFERRIKRAFDACRKAVEEELARHGSESPRTAEDFNSSEPASSNGAPYRREQPKKDRPPGNGGRAATPKQVNALRVLASKSRLAREELDDLFGGKPFDAMTIAEASAAIDRLKGGAAACSNRASFNRYTKGGS